MSQALPTFLWENPKVPPVERTPQLLQVPVDGLSLAVWDWPGDGPPLLFAHAAGFHGRCWDQVIRHFPGRRCLALESRGHGRSSKPAPPYHWPAFAEDVAEIAEKLAIDGALGIGHSLGGHSVTAAAALRPATFAGLLLIDPTIRDRYSYGTPPVNASFIRRRRNRWASPEEMFHRFRNRRPFQHWRSEVLCDYCTFGLLPEHGEFVLACPPEVEASIYECSKEAEAGLHDIIPRVGIPVLVLRAGSTSAPGLFDLNTSPTDPALALQFPHGRDRLLVEYSHFIPMEAPDLVVQSIREFPFTNRPPD